MRHKGLGVVFVMVLLALPACGTEDGREAVSLEPHSLELEDASGSIPDAYGETYLKAVDGNGSDSTVYSLIYLDDDDIPELVALDRGDDSYSVYTVRDGELFCVADSLVTVEMTYYERSGVFAAFSRWNGGGDEGGYGYSYYQISGDQTITEETQSVLSFSYNAIYNEEGAYTGQGVTDYFHMGREVDEASYREAQAGLGIVDGEGRPCIENGCSKEEIIELLK